MSGPTVHTLRVPGASLHVEVRGSGDVLLLIAGGGTDAGIFDSIAGPLSDRYTVVAYDPRGNSRSPLDGPLEDQRIEVHADDAQRLIDQFADEPAFVFGSSSGAQVGLDLLARRPELTKKVVAHEPPAIELLADAARYRAFFDDVHDTYLKEGVRPAMRKFAAGAGLERPGPPPDRELPPRVADMMARMWGNSEFFLQHEMAQFARFVPDVTALEGISERLVVAVGRDSRDRFPSMPAVVLAERMRTEPVEFPGGHAGYASHPAEFASQLADVLS